MQPSPPLISTPIRTTPFLPQSHNLRTHPKFIPIFHSKTFLSAAGGFRREFPVSVTAGSGIQVPVASVSRTSPLETMDAIEEGLEKAIYRCRFMAFLGVLGPLFGSVLCFVKGCTHVVASFAEYFVNRGKVIMLLVEAIDVYLLGTVMLVFGMGLYELFISNLGNAESLSEGKIEHRSNLFGLFTLKERPKWLDITTVNELKTKLGHVIVMLLLIGFFEKSKKTVIQSPGDLLCLAASIFLSSGSLFLLSKLTDPK